MQSFKYSPILQHDNLIFKNVDRDKYKLYYSSFKNIIKSIANDHNKNCDGIKKSKFFRPHYKNIVGKIRYSDDIQNNIKILYKSRKEMSMNDSVRMFLYNNVTTISNQICASSMMITLLSYKNMTYQEYFDSIILTVNNLPETSSIKDEIKEKIFEKIKFIDKNRGNQNNDLTLDFSITDHNKELKIIALHA